MANPIVQIESFTNIPVFFLYTIGVVPFKLLASDKSVSRARRLLENVWFFLCSLNGFYGILSLCMYMLVYLEQMNFVDLCEIALCVGFLSLSFAKVGSVVYHKQNLSILYSELAVIFPQTLKKQEQYHSKTFAKTYNRWANIYAWLQMVMIALYSLMPLLNSMLNFSWTGEWNVDYTFRNWYPFESYERGIFEITYLCQLWSAYYAAVGTMGAVLLLSGLVLQFNMQFKHLANRIREFKPSKGHCHNWAVDRVMIEQIVKYHAKLLRLSNDLDAIFCQCVLFNFVSSILIICLLGFLVITAGQSHHILKFGFTLAACTGQILTVCRVGQILMDAV